MRKHALSSQGGKAIAHGDPELAKPLVRALEASREEPDTLTHGFHSYPARMHPAIARRVLQSYPGGLVVDPFCGSGTVLVDKASFTRAGAEPVAGKLVRMKSDKLHQRIEALAYEAGARS